MATVVRKCGWVDDIDEKTHEATLSFQTTADVFEFNYGNGQTVYFSTDSMRALLDCMRQMDHRIEVKTILH